MPTIKINDINIYYEQAGQGEPLVLIGGLTADHNVWRPAVRHLSDRFQVLIFDNRGAGQSSAPDMPYTTKMMADDTVALMQHLDIEKAHIIGHSMGGCIAQQIAIHHPAVVNKLVVACSRSKPSHLADMALSMRAKLMDKNVGDLLLTEYMMPFLFSEYFLKNLSSVKGFIQWTLKNPHPQTATGFKNQLHAVMTHNVTDDVEQLIAPTLVIAADEDCLMPPRMGKAFAETLPNAQFKVIEKSGHLPHVEQSKIFVDVVKGFLS